MTCEANREARTGRLELRARVRDAGRAALTSALCPLTCDFWQLRQSWTITTTAPVDVVQCHMTGRSGRWPSQKQVDPSGRREMGSERSGKGSEIHTSVNDAHKSISVLPPSLRRASVGQTGRYMLNSLWNLHKFGKPQLSLNKPLSARLCHGCLMPAISEFQTRAVTEK